MIAGLWLRVLLGTAAAAAVTTAAGPVLDPAATGPLVVGAVGLIGWLVLSPGSVAAAILITAAVLMRLILGADTVDGDLIALVVLLPLVHQTAALAAQLPATSVARWAALRPSAVRYAAVVAAVLAALSVIALIG